MSIKVLKVRDPRIDFQPDRIFSAVIGGANVTTKSYSSDTASNAQIIWNITTPSVNVALQRIIDVEYSFYVSCKEGAVQTPVNPNWLNNPYANSTSAGFRQWPLHSVIEVANIRLNDQSISYEPAEIITAMTRYGNDQEDRQHFMSATPHMPDFLTSYSEALTGPLSGSRNPFVSYENSGFEDSRNFKAWFKSEVVGNQIKFTFIESLMISPFYWGRESSQYQGVTGIQNIDLTLTLGPVIKMLAGIIVDGFVSTTPVPPALANTPFVVTNVANAVLSVDLAEQTAQKLHLMFLTPPVGDEVPRLVHLPYYSIKKYQQKITDFTRGSTVSVNLNNITLDSVPGRIYMFAKLRNNTNNQVSLIQTPDYFMQIQALTFNWDNSYGLFSSMDSYDLWKLSCVNSLKMSYLEWSKYLGSVLCIEPKDWNMSPYSCAGVRGNYQMSGTITLKDLSLADKPVGSDWYLYMVVVPVGVLTVQDQLVSVSTGPLDAVSVSQAEWAPRGTQLKVSNYYGSGFWSNLWSGLKKGFKAVAPVVRGIANTVSQVAPLIPHPAAQGIGVGAAAVNKALGGRKMRGGARMRASSLARRL